METNPRIVFERMLGDGSTPEERAARQRQLSSLLDSVTGQVAGSQRGAASRGSRAHGSLLTTSASSERRLALAADSAPELEVPDKPSSIPAISKSTRC